MPFNGLGMNLGNLSRLSSAKTRSISPENFTGEKGKGGMATEGTGARCARDLGQGWKVIALHPHRARRSVATIADIDGPGAIQQIWMTPTGHWRFSILRIYWDGQETALGRVPGRRLLRLRLAASTRRSPRSPSASTPAAPSTATGRCPSASAAASP